MKKLKAFIASLTRTVALLITTIVGALMVIPFALGIIFGPNRHDLTLLDLVTLPMMAIGSMMFLFGLIKLLTANYGGSLSTTEMDINAIRNSVNNIERK